MKVLVKDDKQEFPMNIPPITNWTMIDSQCITMFIVEYKNTVCSTLRDYCFSKSMNDVEIMNTNHCDSDDNLRMNELFVDFNVHYSQIS